MFQWLIIQQLSGPVPKIYAHDYRLVGVGICVIFYQYLHFHSCVLISSNRLLSHSCLSGIWVHYNHYSKTELVCIPFCSFYFVENTVFLLLSLEGNMFLCNSSVIHGCSDLTVVTSGNCFAICHSVSFSFWIWNLTTSIWLQGQWLDRKGRTIIS
jgi:hypothetical protein